MTSFEAARRTMVDCQLRTFDVNDRAVLAAMAQVPRERFMPERLAELAYLDRNVALGADESDRRVALAPMILARMLQALVIRSGDKVLDVAGGLGYTSAVLTAIGARPVLLEGRDDLARGAAERLGVGALVRTGPLENGSAEDGPFDGIVVNGAVERQPATLLEQLADGGRLVCLSVESGPGRALIYVKSGTGTGYRALFDASAPVLAAFRREPNFTF